MQTWPIDAIRPYHLQPSGRARDTTDLQASQDDIGILHSPIVVPDGDGQAVCLAGWRTITAARARGQKEIEVVVREDLAGDETKQAKVFAQSNIHRELAPLEKAGLVMAWAGEGRSVRWAASALSITETEARHLVNLAQAPEEVKEQVGARDGIAWTTFKAELSNLPDEVMLQRLEEAEGTTRKALSRARRKAGGSQQERAIETTDYILGIIKNVREEIGQVEVFLRTATEEARQEVLLALQPVREKLEEVFNE